MRSTVSNKACFDELRTLLDERFSTSHNVREYHGKDESFHTPFPPEAVVFAHSNEEVSETVRICHRYKTPVIPFGTGTSLEGHVAALQGGVCIDLSEMNQVLEVNNEDLDCRVQAGVTRKQLNHALRDTGLFFPVDPGADASLGGMVSTRAFRHQCCSIWNDEGKSPRLDRGSVAWTNHPQPEIEPANLLPATT